VVTSVIFGISIGHRIFAPKYRNIGHWKFYANYLTLDTAFKFNAVYQTWLGLTN